LDHPGLGFNKPSVLMDQLSALRPDSMVDVTKLFFFQKMLSYIPDVVNPRDYKTLADLMHIALHRNLEKCSQDAVALPFQR
jgi:hypothetical protein